MNRLKGTLRSGCLGCPSHAELDEGVFCRDRFVRPRLGRIIHTRTLNTGMPPTWCPKMPCNRRKKKAYRR